GDGPGHGPDWTGARRWRGTRGVHGPHRRSGEQSGTGLWQLPAPSVNGGSWWSLERRSIPAVSPESVRAQKPWTHHRLARRSCLGVPRPALETVGPDQPDTVGFVFA